MDAGYFYEYHGSVHPHQFVESGLKIYVISDTHIESLYAWTDTEYRLVCRTVMNIDEWEAFKQTVKDEFSPEGYVNVVYEE